jgi:hypothetical protein
MSTQYRLVQSGKTASGGCSAGQGSSELSRHGLLLLLLLLHIHLSPPREVWDSSDQATHHHHLGPKLRTSFLTQHFGWKQNKTVKETQ